MAPAQVVEIHQTAAQLECAQWAMVLVLDPHLRANTIFEQWPPIFRSRRHHPVDERCCGLELTERGEPAAVPGELRILDWRFGCYVHERVASGEGECVRRPVAPVRS